jgi:hypothetical protein
MLDLSVASIVGYVRERTNAYLLSDFLDRSCSHHCNLNSPHCDGPGGTGQELPDGTAMPLERFQEILRLGKSLPIGSKLAMS